MNTDSKRKSADVAQLRILRRLAWIIQVGPKCNHRGPYKRETEGDSTQVIWKQDALLLG